MPKALLDTDILSELMRDKNEVVRGRANAYLAAEQKLTISAITVLEVIKGLHKMQRTAEIDRFRAALSSMEVIPVSTEEAIEAGRIYAELESIGRPIGRADPMVAAVAIVHGLILVTGNESHYRRIQDLVAAGRASSGARTAIAIASRNWLGCANPSRAPEKAAISSSSRMRDSPSAA